jgi:hypothetical protein
MAWIPQPLQPLSLHHLLPQRLLTLRRGPLILPLHPQPSRPFLNPIRIQFSISRICLRIFHPLPHRFPVAQILQPLQPLSLHHPLPQGLLTLGQGPLILLLHLWPSRPPADPIRIQFSMLRIYRYQLRTPCFLLQWPHIIRPSLTLPP